MPKYSEDGINQHAQWFEYFNYVLLKLFERYFGIDNTDSITEFALDLHEFLHDNPMPEMD
ncbi:MAG TPA: hypothetical protein VKR58_01045 [Aquella sp.]|nr:hypothetical protein [Aquella sp.]